MTTEKVMRPPYRWGDLRRLVPPGRWFAPRIEHIERCTCRCSEVPCCPTCGKPSQSDRVRGRWDPENQRTAIPFDPVWVRMSCGCTFGDSTLAEPFIPTGNEKGPS